MVTIYRYINGISLNPREYLLDEQDNLLEFDSVSQACEFLGIASDEDPDDYGIYFEEGEQSED